MKADHVRSIRLNHLLKLALAGADETELTEKAMTWVSRKTALDYIDQVKNLLRVKFNKELKNA